MYEKVRTPDWPYDGGWRANLASVFGRAPSRWGVPTLSRAEARALLDDALRKPFAGEGGDLELGRGALRG